MTESKRWINVYILGHTTVSIYACTIWHALELAHTKFMHLEADRSKYLIKSKSI